MVARAVRDKNFALVNFGNISFGVGPLWTGHINASLTLLGEGITYHFHLGLVSAKNCYTTILFHLLLEM